MNAGTVSAPNISAREVPKTFWALSAYFALTFVGAISPNGRFTPDFLIAPLYLLLPTGVGLLLASPLWRRTPLHTWVPHSWLLAAAAFIGLVGVTYAYLLLSTVVWLEDVYLYFYLALHALSLLGYWAGRQALRLDQDTRLLGKQFAFALPFAALSYWFYYLQFAAPPLRDVFQEVHFMKGALEIARYGFFNPMASALSYIPVLQFNFAHLHRFYGYDLLNAQWLQPWVLFPLHFVAYRAVVSSVVANPRIQAAAMAFVAATLQPMLSGVNGSLLLAMCLLLLGLLIRNPLGQKPAQALTIALTVLAALGLYLGLAYLEFERVGAAWWTFAGVLLVLSRLPTASTAATMAFLLFLCVTAFTVHRGVVLFLPMTLLAYIGYTVAVRYSTRVQPGFKLALVASLAAFALITLLPQWVYALLPKDDVLEGDGALKRELIELMGQLGFDAEIVADNSVLVALAEWLRQVPIYEHIVVVLLSIWFLADFRRARGGPMHGPQSSGALCLKGQDVFFYIAGTSSIFVFIALSPVPYAYRGIYFPALFTAIMAGWLLVHCTNAASGRIGVVRRRWLVLLTLAYLVISAIALYGYDIILSRNANSYLQAGAGYYKGLFAATLALGFVVLFRMTGAPAGVALCAFVALASHIDKVSMTMYLYPHSYRAQLPPDEVISHYAPEELAAAKELSTLPYNTIVVTDPYTLSILRARTGLNGLYSYANLDTISKTGTEMLKEVLSYAIDGDVSARSAEEFTLGLVRRVVYFVHRAGASSELSYAYGCGMDRRLNGRNATRDVIVVLTTRTIEWVRGQSTYYPNLKRFDQDYVSTRIAPFYRIAGDIEGKVLLLRLRKEHMENFDEASIWQDTVLMRTPPVPLTGGGEPRCRTLGFPIAAAGAQ